MGDSYTIGEGIQLRDSYPRQLETRLELELDEPIDLQLIATTGWSTSDLLQALSIEEPPAHFDLVTLLIGVNNQFRNQPFSIYETEFPELLEQAIRLAKNSPDRVLVLSIPDYSYSPAGGNNGGGQISEEIDRYNAFAKAASRERGVKFITITDISRRALQESDLIAEDNLHLSKKAYGEITERLFPFAFGLFL
ncbi:SGNH/GDSL hydrolase family protein [Croceiramulus getboli]|nr:SGNH/GDSL hydrolase family protein [Flavobacteriaceae bacterium YJPT1-3]